MLIFDSRFESGNLRKASKVNNVEYNLWLDNDLNTKGHTQWYYFKVVYQSDKPAKIQFNILNLSKTYSLYKQGMKPVVFSLKKFHQKYPGRENELDPPSNKDCWQRACENIKYF
jgi:cytosolic carboxypeptidase protein 2/3